MSRFGIGMAQWRRQYSRLTHHTKVRDRQATLRAAVAAFQAAGGVDATPRLIDLARRVLHARAKHLEAQLAELREPTGNGALPSQIERLEERLHALTAGGVVAILVEFRGPPAVIDAASVETT